MAKSILQRNKRKTIKQVAIQVLLEDELDKILDQVKEVTEEDFDWATQKQEERHSDVQAQIATLQ